MVQDHGQQRADVRGVMKTKLFAIAMFTIAAASAQVSIRIGPPPPPRIIRVQPRNPGNGYIWVEGYYYPVGNHYKWHNGYWTRPPYGGARWISPRYEGDRYYDGGWDGERGKKDHDHHSDRGKDRDYRRDDDRR